MLQKVYTVFMGDSMGNITTDYLDGFQYMSEDSYSDKVAPFLMFFPTTEGYVSTGSSLEFYYNPHFYYVYNYTDHVGNVRLSYHRDVPSGNPVADQENNYYPFGLQHSGYNSISSTPAYNYKYQGQELQESGFYSFKWREYMPDIGRFAQVDPLASKYPYNTPYAIQENKLGLGRELEGLELVPRGSGIFEQVYNSNFLYPRTEVLTVAANVPASQKDIHGNPVFDAPSIGLLTDGYDPNRLVYTSGKGFILPERPSAPEEPEMIDGKDVNPSQPFEKSNFLDAVKLVADVIVGTIDKIRGVSEAQANLYNTAVKDIIDTTNQARLMGRAEGYVNKALPNADPAYKANVTNYVFSGQLPQGTMMQNSGITTQGNAIMKANGIQIQNQPKPISSTDPIPKDKL